MERITEDLADNLARIRSKRPLIHNITNFVVMNTTANALLAIGASPVMAHAADEVEDMVAIAQAVVINIGTLNPDWVESMRKAVKRAAELGKPVVLDPVGAGATVYRTEVAKMLLQTAAPAVIRGNASEIRALVDAAVHTRGVDSSFAAHSAVEAAAQLSKFWGCSVVVSGAADFVVQGNRTLKVNNGAPLMGRVTGMGCTATALIGAFCAVDSNSLNAGVHAMAVMGIAGEAAAAKAAGPGSFQMHFLDALYGMGERMIDRRIRIERTF